MDEFKTIDIDYTLFGKLLTEYGRLNGLISFHEIVEVDDVLFDKKCKIVTAFIEVTEEKLN